MGRLILKTMEEKAANRKMLKKEFDDRMRSRTDAQIASDCKLMHPTGKKQCRKCDKTLPIHSFDSVRTSSDGLQTRCKICRLEDAKLLRKRRSERSDEEMKRNRKRLRTDGTKYCFACKETLPLTKFGVDISTSDGTSIKCRDCNAEKQRSVNAECKAMRDEKRSEKCVKCGESNPRCLDLHHLDPKSKFRNSAGKPISPSALNVKSQLERELNLVVPMCANCHIDETYTRHVEDRKQRSLSGEFHPDSERRWERIQRARIVVNMEKSKRNKCVDCDRLVGDKFHMFDFDHVRGKKIECIGQMVILVSLYTSNDINLEMAKCDLRCKNCHRIVTYARAQSNRPSNVQPVK